MGMNNASEKLLEPKLEAAMKGRNTEENLFTFQRNGKHQIKKGNLVKM